MDVCREGSAEVDARLAISIAPDPGAGAPRLARHLKDALTQRLPLTYVCLYVAHAPAARPEGDVSAFGSDPVPTYLMHVRWCPHPDLPGRPQMMATACCAVWLVTGTAGGQTLTCWVPHQDTWERLRRTATLADGPPCRAADDERPLLA
ncbi:hypothetical protein [Streptomyces zagrosensis]|nr:hypothetical protein [Streptomyces zagrosensis]